MIKKIGSGQVKRKSWKCFNKIKCLFPNIRQSIPVTQSWMLSPSSTRDSSAHLLSVAGIDAKVPGLSDGNVAFWS